jgi:hypothetical protein
VQLADRSQHIAERDRTVVPNAIDVERRRAVHTTLETTLPVFLDTTSMLVTGQLAAHTLGVER